MGSPIFAMVFLIRSLLQSGIPSGAKARAHFAAFFGTAEAVPFQIIGVLRGSLSQRSGFECEHLEWRQVKGVRLVYFQHDGGLRGVGGPRTVRQES